MQRFLDRGPILFRDENRGIAPAGDADQFMARRNFIQQAVELFASFGG